MTDTSKTDLAVLGPIVAVLICAAAMVGLAVIHEPSTDDTSGDAGFKPSLMAAGSEFGQPLYIVDGVRVDSISYPVLASVESMDILKDAAATAIYGSRGANGVIILTTKASDTGSTSDETDKGPLLMVPIHGSKEPLYVIDGAIGASIMDFSPNDIEAIQVLKDAAAVAVYGAMAANGVILVSTKVPSA